MGLTSSSLFQIHTRLGFATAPWERVQPFLLHLPAPCTSTVACCMHVYGSMPQASGGQLASMSLPAPVAARENVVWWLQGGSKAQAMHHLRNLAMQLRKACNHPYALATLRRPGPTMRGHSCLQPSPACCRGWPGRQAYFTPRSSDLHLRLCCEIACARECLCAPGHGRTGQCQADA